MTVIIVLLKMYEKDSDKPGNLLKVTQPVQFWKQKEKLHLLQAPHLASFSPHLSQGFLFKQTT
jgi:hypothetical protein